MKGVAILLLLFHHLFYNQEKSIARGMEFSMIPYRYIQIAAVSARICVWMFVFLSAYGLVYQYRKHKEEQTALQFIIKHWFSLMKGYWFVYLCVFVGNFFAAGNTF